jgi:predicted DCC family thiol-disulfide oxidoreductase YuxK
MKRLMVFYDPDCGFCCSVRGWVERQPTYLPVTFLSRESDFGRHVRRALGDVDDDLLVVADDGAYYRGPEAFIVVLWAMQEYRGLAGRLAAPLVRPFARQAFALVSEGRGALSALLGLRSENELASHLRAQPTYACVERF